MEKTLKMMEIIMEKYWKRFRKNYSNYGKNSGKYWKNSRNIGKDNGKSLYLSAYQYWKHFSIIFSLFSENTGNSGKNNGKIMEIVEIKSSPKYLFSSKYHIEVRPRYEN